MELKGHIASTDRRITRAAALRLLLIRL